MLLKEYRPVPKLVTPRSTSARASARQWVSGQRLVAWAAPGASATNGARSSSPAPASHASADRKSVV